MHKLLERLHIELQQYGPEDTFNKDFYLTLTERLIKDTEADGNKYVMLPAYISQIVYAADIRAEYCNGKIYYTCSGINEGKVSMLQQKADGSWKIRVSWYKYIQGSQEYDLGYCSDYTVDGFAKLCATKEAAEIKREEVVNKYLMESKNNIKEEDYE